MHSLLSGSCEGGCSPSLCAYYFNSFLCSQAALLVTLHHTSAEYLSAFQWYFKYIKTGLEWVLFSQVHPRVEVTQAEEKSDIKCVRDEG